MKHPIRAVRFCTWLAVIGAAVSRNFHIRQYDMTLTTQSYFHYWLVKKWWLLPVYLLPVLLLVYGYGGYHRRQDHPLLTVTLLCAACACCGSMWETIHWIFGSYTPSDLFWRRLLERAPYCLSAIFGVLFFLFATIDSRLQLRHLRSVRVVCILHAVLVVALQAIPQVIETVKAHPATHTITPMDWFHIIDNGAAVAATLLTTAAWLLLYTICFKKQGSQ